ncbi:MAG: hypothetical protein JXQ76_11785 [Campylobacterales bacterium]|nr:hypothetical protein [Campylobacterales bacterium]
MGIRDQKNRYLDIENAILSSFFYIDIMLTNPNEYFILDKEIFSTVYKQQIVEKINAETKAKSYFYSVLSIQSKMKRRVQSLSKSFSIFSLKPQCQ